MVPHQYFPAEGVVALQPILNSSFDDDSVGSEEAKLTEVANRIFSSSNIVLLKYCEQWIGTKNMCGTCQSWKLPCIEAILV